LMCMFRVSAILYMSQSLGRVHCFKKATTKKIYMP
jgi:hypothetical protein